MTSIALPARITMGEARAALADISPRLAAADAPVLDASALVELDSAALALLLDCRRQVLARGATLQISGASPKLRQLAALYGVGELLGL
ncbi:MAG TPA: STAS domain-containing protein [Aquabacterium sp.]|nr:STAS domain-containing protein [Aquabacterium sp.]HQC98911.1 STAS domain-containing protein [Aquabacterium sp.]